MNIHTHEGIIYQQTIRTARSTF